MDEVKKKAIQEFLLSHGSSLEAMSKARVQQFLKVYDVIERRKENINAARNTLSQNAITLVAISEETGISRKTFYNNKLLKQYVEEQASQFDDLKTPAKEKAEFKEQINQLKERIRLLMLRDLDKLKLEHEITELTKEIAEKDTRIANMEKEYAKVCRDLSVTQEKLKKKDATYVFNPF